MKRLLEKIAIATTTIACATLFTIDWSEQRGVSLSTQSAEARIGRPLTPLSGAGVARRQYRRAGYGYGGYGYGAGVVGAGLAAGAVGAAAVAAATSPYYGGQPYYSGQAYGYASDPNAAYASANQGWGGGYYAESPWGYYECQPANSPYVCQPYSQAYQNWHY